MILSIPCKSCGGNNFENFSPTQIRCTHCGNISLLRTEIKPSTPNFQLSSDESLLDFEKKKEYVIASLGKRFLNYIIDLFFIGLFWVILFWISEGISGFKGEDEDMISGFALLLSFPLYYIIMEYKFGKTIGKFITKTKVVSKDGKPLSIGQCIGRLFCRIIPFERFSGLFSDGVFWHDSIPGTLIVED